MNMVTRKISFRILASLAVLALAWGCQKPGESGDDDAAAAYTDADLALLKTFTDDVVLVIYHDMDAKALLLNDALIKLRDNPSESNFTAAKNAWLAVRVPWEQSEGFLTGPVDSQGLDPAMDTWPVQPSEIADEIAKVNGNDVRDLDQVGVSAKGFHAIEFLLFGEEGSKTLATQTAAERSYLVSLASSVQDVIKVLLASWEESFEGGPSYRERLLNSGRAENGAFATSRAAVDDVVEKLSGIAEEVGTVKVGGPHGDKTAPIESEYSDNSLRDFQDNIRGFRFVYQGSTTNTVSAASIKARVKAKNPALDAKVEQLMDDAIAAIQNIPAPFRTSAASPAADAKITAAETLLRELRDLVATDVAEAVK
jgi:predicted lipoprotein